MAKWIGAWVLMVLVGSPTLVHGQVYSGGNPDGYTLVPMAPVAPDLPASTGMLSKGNDLRACTSGPDLMLIAGYRYDGIWAVGGPFLMSNQVYEVPILSMWELAQESSFDEDDEITALAATPDRKAVYASFHPIFPTASCLPILRVELDGTWTEAVSCDELGAFESGANRVRNLATAADGTLYAIVRYQDVGLDALLRIDPAGPPGKRTELLLAGDTLLPDSPELTGNALFLQVAALDGGRVVVLAQVGLVKDGFTDPGYVLLRRDADGSVTEITARECAADAAPVDSERHLPAMACLEGMLFDHTDGLLLCGGNGNVFLIDPDEPGRSSLVIPSFVVENTLASFKGEPVYSPPAGAQGPGSCLGDISFGENRAYGTWMGTFMIIAWDEQLLDLDDDLAMGYQEAAWGTHRFTADTDGGGTGDGLELVGYTDPLNPDDDRHREEPVMRWVRPGLWFGSAAGNSTPSRHSIGGSGLAADDGSLLLFGAGAGNELLRFTGYDEPLVPSGMKGGDHMALGPDGCVYRHEEGEGILRSCAAAEDQTLITGDNLAAVAGSKPVDVKGVAVQPDGTVFLGTRSGLLLAVDPAGAASVVYDMRADYEAYGIWTEEEECFGGMACAFYIGPMVYEPVHGMLMFWAEVDFIGSASFGFMLDLVALLPDGNMRRVADHWAFAESMDMLGGLQPLGMVPDLKGGVWVVGEGGGGYRLLHLEGSRLEPVRGMTDARPMQPDNPNTGGLALMWASNVMVRTDGHLFVPEAHFSAKTSAVPFGLAELVPLRPGIAAGDLLVVDPDEATLSRLQDDGGGELLVQGEPFSRPAAVAAADGLVAVGDAGLGAVLVSQLDEDGGLGSWTSLAAVAQPTGMDIDDQGRILVVDAATRSLLRIGTGGGIEELASGDLLGEPVDVVATASGAAAVTDAQGGRLLRVSAAGEVTTLAELANPGSVALVAGEHYVVSSTAGDLWPRTVDGDGAIGATGGADTSWPPAGEPVGGLAAAPDGTLFHAMVRTSNWDWKDPYPTSRVFRITTDGYAQSMVRFGLLVGGGPTDLCRVRGVGEPLPTEPGDKPLPMPVDEDRGETGGGGGGCSASPAGGAAPLALLVALLGLLAWPRWRRGFPVAALALLLGAVGCGGSGTGDIGAEDAWTPGEVPEQCQAKDLCKPAGPPVCVDGTAGSKRCVTDDEGCWVWSEVRACPADAPCQDGVCGGRWCMPTCDTFAECGDDGCGGTCGSCTAPEVCCNGICATCVSDCAGRECGWDGATGSCGTCKEGNVCVHGKCREKGTAGCGEFVNECDVHCEPWDQDCLQECLAWLSQLGAIDLLAFEGCELLHCAECFEPEAEPGCLSACVYSHCVEELASCFHRFGTATCQETWDCAEACSPTDQPCIDGCTAKATREAMVVLIDLVLCVEAVCPPESPDAERLACEAAARSNECAAEADACYGPCEPFCAPIATCGPDQCTGLCGVCPDGQVCNGTECLEMN